MTISLAGASAGRARWRGARRLGAVTRLSRQRAELAGAGAGNGTARGGRPTGGNNTGISEGPEWRGQPGLTTCQRRLAPFSRHAVAADLDVERPVEYRKHKA